MDFAASPPWRHPPLSTKPDIRTDGPSAPRLATGGTVLGVSFDGLAVSGIVNEFLNIAHVLRGRGFRALLDLGYDITLRETIADQRLMPSWIELVRAFGDPLPATYRRSVIEEATVAVIDGTPIEGIRHYADISQQLAERLVATFLREHVDLLVVENGTLPDNPIATEALHLAIKEYGARRQLGRYVLWRDWDLMWSTEPQLYGRYPFPGVRKPQRGDHIHYAVATEWMKRRMQAWAPGVEYHVIPSRFFSLPSRPARRKSLRLAYSIPRDAFLVARCTRVIPQKCIERDLLLFDLVQQRLGRSGDRRQVFLFVSGPTTEDIEEFERLSALQRTLSIAAQVVWGNGLLPFNRQLASASSAPAQFSIHELLVEADLSSFLTAFDYEGFGNPPGEAMAVGVPFIATTYELFHDVYGNRGAVAPLLAIHRESTARDPIPEEFVDWVLQLLTDATYRSNVIAHNLAVSQRYFSLEALERQLTEIFN